MVFWKSLLHSDRALNAEQQGLRVGHCDRWRPGNCGGQNENGVFCFQICPAKSKNEENLTTNEESEKSAGSSLSGWGIALE